MRGKYAGLPRGCKVVVLDPDVAQVFPDSESVNQALRALAGIIVRKDPSLAVRDRRHAKTARWTQNLPPSSVRGSWNEEKTDKSRLDSLTFA